MIGLRGINYTEATYPFGVNREGTVVYNFKSERIIKLHIGTHGYKAFRNTHTDKIQLVHRLVCMVYLDNPRNCAFVNHKDSDRLNNNVDNLEWCTPAENAQHARDNNRMSLNCTYGEENNLHMFSDEKIHEVCKDLQEGMRNIDVAKKHNMSSGYIKTLKAKKQRERITRLYTFPESKKRSVSEPTVRWVCDLIRLGKKNSEIIAMANNKNVSKILLKNIKRKTSYKSISDEYF